MSLVTSLAASASVRATSRVGTPQTSAASRADTSLATASWVGTSTLPPMWPHFFGRGELVFEMNPGGPGLDHLLHQFERIEGTTESGLGIGHDGGEPVGPVFPAVQHLNLVGTTQGVVDAPDHRRHAVGWIQALVRIHLIGQVGVGGHLPAAQVNGLEPGLHLLDRLVARQGAQRRYVVLMVDQVPQALGADFGKGIRDGQVAAQFEHVFGRVGADDAFPAGIPGPVGFQFIAFVGHYFVTGQAFTDLFGFLFNGFLILPPDVR